MKLLVASLSVNSVALNVSLLLLLLLLLSERLDVEACLFIGTLDWLCGSSLLYFRLCFGGVVKT